MRAVTPMSDPFFTRGGLFFMLAVSLLCVISPVLIEWSGALSDYDRYGELPDIGYAFHAYEITEATSAIDLLVIGSSTTMTGTDCLYLQDALTAHLQRPAVVTCLVSNRRSEVVFSIFLNDILKRRKVRMVLLEEPRDIDRDREHPFTHYFWKPLEHGSLLRGMPLDIQLKYYGQAILGVPRHLLSLVRRNNIRATVQRLEPFIHYRGAPPHLVGFKSLLKNAPAAEFFEVSYTPPRVPLERMIFRGESHPFFAFQGPPLSEIQIRGLRRMQELANAHGALFAMLHYPLPYREKHIRLRTYDPRRFDGYLTVVSVAPNDLYPEFTPTMLRELWANESHPNWNGAQYDTRVFAPAILELYDQTQR